VHALNDFNTLYLSGNSNASFITKWESRDNADHFMQL
jgi:hypothetical protein